jgi:Uma2 family endonuclease
MSVHSEWREIVMSPVGKTHGIAAMRIGEALRKSLGGHTMAEVGIATAIGVRPSDVAWCSDAFLAAHPEEAPLSGSPEICVEIVSASNALPKLREKAMAYINAGALEAWIAHPGAKGVDIYDREGRKPRSSMAIDLTALWGQ